jgi:hypothetical protein
MAFPSWPVHLSCIVLGMILALGSYRRPFMAAGPSLRFLQGRVTRISMSGRHPLS